MLFNIIIIIYEDDADWQSGTVSDCVAKLRQLDYGIMNSRAVSARPYRLNTDKSRCKMRLIASRFGVHAYIKLASKVFHKIHIGIHAGLLTLTLYYSKQLKKLQNVKCS